MKLWLSAKPPSPPPPCFDRHPICLFYSIFFLFFIRISYKWEDKSHHLVYMEHVAALFLSNNVSFSRIMLFVWALLFYRVCSEQRHFFIAFIYRPIFNLTLPPPQFVDESLGGLVSIIIFKYRYFACLVIRCYTM